MDFIIQAREYNLLKKSLFSTLYSGTVPSPMYTEYKSLFENFNHLLLIATSYAIKLKIHTQLVIEGRVGSKPDVEEMEELKNSIVSLQIRMASFNKALEKKFPQLLGIAPLIGILMTVTRHTELIERLTDASDYPSQDLVETIDYLKQGLEYTMNRIL